MNRQVGKVSLGLLCLVAGGLWMAYKFEYLQLLSGSLGNSADSTFDTGAEQRLLLLILSPGLVLLAAGLVMVVRSMIKRGRRPNRPVAV